MRKIRCAICHEIMCCCIYCHQMRANICMNHCPTCSYFAGRSTWGCRYKLAQGPPKTRGEQAVTQFKQKMQEIEKRISAKKRKS